MAKYKLLLPKMGESVAEATIIKWTKKPGDLIETDETVMEIATDKVDSDVPSPVSGRLVEQLYKENDVVQVGSVIALIETEEQNEIIPPAAAPVQHSYQEQQPPVEHTPPPVAETYKPEQEIPEPVKAPEPQPEPKAPEQSKQDIYFDSGRDYAAQVPYTPQPEHKPAPAAEAANGNGLRFYSPLVKNIAAQEGISSTELDRITGTGAEGRLTKDDLLNYIEQKKVQQAAPPPAAPAFKPEPPPAPPVEPEPAKAPIVEAAKETTVAVPQVVEIPAPVIQQPAPVTAPVAETPQQPVYDAPKPTPVAETPPPVSPPATEAPIAPIAEIPAPAAQPIVEAPKPTPVAEPVKPVQEAAHPASLLPPPTVEAPKAKPLPVTEQPAPEPAKQEPVEEKPSAPARSMSGGDEIIEMDRMGRLIADHMVMSKHTSPHVTSFVEADVTNLVLWREKIKGKFEKREGEKITYTPLFIEAVVMAIKDFPMINVSVNGTQIIKKKDINISMATALPSGNLIVPVIKKADELNIVGLTKAVNDLANRARNNKLKPDDIAGGTFTVTNVGSFGNVMGTPIINQPQVAVLAVGAIKKKPAVIETLQGDMIGIRHMMFLSLSYDHRVVNGALGGSFVRRVADYLENWDIGREI